MVSESEGTFEASGDKTCQMAERQARKGNVPPVTSWVQMWFPPGKRDTAYSTDLRLRKMDTRNGETRQEFSQDKLEQATRL